MKLLTEVVAVVLILNAIVVLLPIEACTNTDGNVLYVGGEELGNYARIQDAINASSSGDTVFVFNGIYHENVDVDKTINLIGEDRDSTIIDGGRSGNTVHILSENVVITGFTISNGSIEEDIDGSNWFYAGIRLTASGSIIYGNIICDNRLGIFGKKVENITIFDNVFHNDGITFSL